MARGTSGPRLRAAVVSWFRGNFSRSILMPRAVRFDRHGPVDVLTVSEVGRPTPERGQVQVRVKPVGINLGDAKTRPGLMLRG